MKLCLKYSRLFFFRTRCIIGSSRFCIVQGSALGPVSYVVTASDLKPLSSSNVTLKYADDTIHTSLSRLPVILLVSLKSRILKLGPIETILNLTGKNLVKLYSSDPSQTGILKYFHPLYKDFIIIIIYLLNKPIKNKKLSYCWETVRRESMPRIAEMDVEMTT